MTTADKLLVHYKESKDRNSFYHFWYEGNPATFIQSMQIAKDLGVECRFNNFSDMEDLKAYDGFYFYVHDVKVNLPTEEDLFAVTIEIDSFNREGELW